LEFSLQLINSYNHPYLIFVAASQFRRYVDPSGGRSYRSDDRFLPYCQRL